MDPKIFILDVDAIFKAVEMFTPPQYQWIEQFVNTLLDQYATVIAPLIPAGLGVRAFVDALFTQLELKLAGHPFLLMALKAVQGIIDQYLPQAMPVLLAQGYTA
jgi:hypothetical protein